MKTVETKNLIMMKYGAHLVGTGNKEEKNLGGSIIANPEKFGVKFLRLQSQCCKNKVAKNYLYELESMGIK